VGVLQIAPDYEGRSANIKRRRKISQVLLLDLVRTRQRHCLTVQVGEMSEWDACVEERQVAFEVLSAAVVASHVGFGRKSCFPRRQVRNIVPSGRGRTNDVGRP